MLRLTRDETHIFLALSLCSVAGAALLLCRLAYTGATSFGFLPWNLFLAWLPFGAAGLLRLLERERALTRGRAAALLVAWLLLFPNAPYLVTDFQHLRPRPEAPLWFDIGVLTTFAWTGMLLGFVSLYWVQEFLRVRLGSAWSTAIALGVLALSGYGIYLGRFARLNSWDVLLRPWDVASQLLGVVLDPRSHPRTLAVTVLYGALLTLAYLTLLTFARLAAATISPTPRREDACPARTT